MAKDSGPKPVFLKISGPNFVLYAGHSASRDTRLHTVPLAASDWREQLRRLIRNHNYDLVNPAMLADGYFDRKS